MTHQVAGGNCRPDFIESYSSQNDVVKSFVKDKVSLPLLWSCSEGYWKLYGSQGPGPSPENQTKVADEGVRWHSVRPIALNTL